MSEEQDHVEPKNPRAEDLADRLFVIGMAALGGFIAVVFIFIL